MKRKRRILPGAEHFRGFCRPETLLDGPRRGNRGFVYPPVKKQHHQRRQIEGAYGAATHDRRFLVDWPTISPSRFDVSSNAKIVNSATGFDRRVSCVSAGHNSLLCPIRTLRVIFSDFSFVIIKVTKDILPLTKLFSVTALLFDIRRNNPSKIAVFRNSVFLSFLYFFYLL